MGKSKDQAEINLAIRLFKQGNPIGKIQNILGWSRNTLLKYLRQANIYQKRPGKPGRKSMGKIERRILPHLGDIHKRNAAGETLDILSSEYGLSKVRLAELLRKHFHTFPEHSLRNLNQPVDWSEIAEYADGLSDD